MKKITVRNLIYGLLIAVVIGIAIAMPFSLAKYQFDVKKDAPITASVQYVGNHTESIAPEKAPTCTEAGYTEFRRCTGCGEITQELETIPALGHSYTAQTATAEYLKTAGTCQSEAVYYKSCVRCGLSSAGQDGEATFEGALDPNNHTGSIIDATEENACQKYSCCGAVTETTHNMTNTGEANACQTCSECGYVDSTHTAVNGGTASAHTKCSVCEYVISTAHDYDEEIITAATCTTNGTKKFTCSCGHSYTESIAATGHNWNAWTKVTDPTTSATGSISRTCKNDAAHKENFTMPILSTGNGYTYKVVTEATCTATGTGRYTYVKDGTTFTYDVIIAKIAHTPGAAATCTTAQTCTVCGTTLNAALGHNYTNYTVKTAPTTSAAGSITGTCSRCSGTTTVTLPKLDTTNYTKTTTTAATCTATGTDKYTWKTNTYGTFSFNVTTAMIAHTSVSGGTAGVHTKCSVCGATLSTTHSYSKSTQTAATCASKGVTKYTCSCGYSYTARDIAVSSSHGTIKSGSIAATTTQAGLSYSYCSVCMAITSGPTPTNPTSSVASNTYDANAGKTSFTRSDYRAGVKFDFTNNTMTDFDGKVVSRAKMNSTDLRAIAQYDDLDKYDKFLCASGNNVSLTSIINGTYNENDSVSYDHFQPGDVYYITFVYYASGSSTSWFSANYNGAQGVANVGATTAADGNVNLHIASCPGRYYDGSSGDSAQPVSGAGAYTTTVKYVVNSTFDGNSNDDTALDCLWLYNVTGTMYIAEIFVELLPSSVGESTPTVTQLKAGYSWPLNTLKIGTSTYGNYDIKNESGNMVNTAALQITGAGELAKFNRPAFFQPGYRYLITISYYTTDGSATLIEYTNVSGNHNVTTQQGAFPKPADGAAWTTVHGFEVQANGQLPSAFKYGLTFYNQTPSNIGTVYITSFKIQLITPDTAYDSVRPNSVTTSTGIGSYSFASGNVPALSSGNGEDATSHYIQINQIPFYASTSEYAAGYNEMRKIVSPGHGFNGAYAYHSVMQQSINLDFTQGKLTAKKTYTVSMRIYVNSSTMEWLRVISMNSGGAQEGDMSGGGRVSYENIDTNIYQISFQVTTGSAPSYLKLYIMDHHPISDIYIASISVS